jgi:hypothetical protein
MWVIASLRSLLMPDVCACRPLSSYTHPTGDVLITRVMRRLQVLNAENAGARAVVMLNDEDVLMSMGGDDTHHPQIPAMHLPSGFGKTLRQTLALGTRVRAEVRPVTEAEAAELVQSASTQYRGDSADSGSSQSLASRLLGSVQSPVSSAESEFCLASMPDVGADPVEVVDGACSTPIADESLEMCQSPDRSSVQSCFQSESLSGTELEQCSGQGLDMVLEGGCQGGSRDIEGLAGGDNEEQLALQEQSRADVHQWQSESHTATKPEERQQVAGTEGVRVESRDLRRQAGLSTGENGWGQQQGAQEEHGPGPRPGPRPEGGAKCSAGEQGQAAVLRPGMAGLEVDDALKRQVRPTSCCLHERDKYDWKWMTC